MRQRDTGRLLQMARGCRGSEEAGVEPVEEGGELTNARPALTGQAFCSQRLMGCSEISLETEGS